MAYKTSTLRTEMAKLRKTAVDQLATADEYHFAALTRLVTALDRVINDPFFICDPNERKQ